MNNHQKKTPDQIVAYDYFIKDIQTNNPDYLPDREDVAFELFSARLIMKKHQINETEIENGVVGGPKDGGIDSVFAFLDNTYLPNGELDEDEKQASKFPKRSPLDLYFIQSKNEFSWKEDVWLKLESTIKLMLNWELPEDKLNNCDLNDDIINFALHLRSTHQKLALVMPVIRVHCIYISFGMPNTASKSTLIRGKQLCEDLSRLLPSNAIVKADYWDCLRIANALAESPNRKCTLQIADHAIRERAQEDDDEQTRKPDNFIALVTIKDYLNFIHQSDDNEINYDMFEGNVRDFAGTNVDVNKAISNTLNGDTNAHFWWLNNGITVLADDTYESKPNNWVIENPLIVNGLQTSFVLDKAQRDKAITDERLKECILVRVIVSNDDQIRQDIITGTNNQTAIAKMQLHANDPLQTRIQRYLKKSNWFYERRRYQYRGKNVQSSKIRTIKELSQAVMAYRLLVPDQARARPMTFLNKKTGKGWDQVFPKDADLTLYEKALNVQNIVDNFLKSPKAKAISTDSLNSRFYLTAGYSLLCTKIKDIEDFQKISSSALEDEPTESELVYLLRTFVAVSKKYASQSKRNDQIYKSSEFRDQFFAEIIAHNNQEGINAN